ncbi:unnamed protein product [Cylindrotheca closterium]|uniref:ABC transporter domain-containing protein n=1 Tax=Cylindrotheca closterium TaxID=2856 RepID=A0AAD2JLW8_9STRA|nr:unnamed protein product [Cylindrotheca closterium]
MISKSSLSSLSSRSLPKRGLSSKPYCHGEMKVPRCLGKKRSLSSSSTAASSAVAASSSSSSSSTFIGSNHQDDIIFHCRSRPNSCSFRNRSYSSSSLLMKSAMENVMDEDENNTNNNKTALVHYPGTTRLSYPNDNNAENDESFELVLDDFTIAKPERKGGGHLLLGRNGSGKSLLVDFLHKPEKYCNNKGASTTTHEAYDVASVSFDSHKELLRDHPDASVYRILTEDGFGGTLSKSAQYLVVRFGLFPLLYRKVSTLSTGEIRKVLIIRALCDGGANAQVDLSKQKFRSKHKDPKLLILENAFDGLDSDSRLELQSIVSKTIKGLDKSGKLLIQQVQASSVRPIQVFMSTHRPEEIMDEISTVSMAISESGTTSDNNNNNNNNKCKVVTFERPKDMTRETLLRTALELDDFTPEDSSETTTTALAQADDDLALPSLEAIRAAWQNDNATHNTTPDVLLGLDQVQIQRPKDTIAEDESPQGKPQSSSNDDNDNLVTLLHELSWKIEKGQRWIIAGGNGAGKSTLTRFLLQGSGLGSTRDNKDKISGQYHIDPATKVGWMSTESHLQMVVGQQQQQPQQPQQQDDDNEETNNDIGVWDILCDHGRIPENVANTFASWVVGDSARLEHIKTLPFDQLSQGEQKLVLLSATLARRPNLLILDEPTTALDSIARKRVLALLERICQATQDDLTLILITHYQDEWVPSVSHVLNLVRGNTTFQGPKSEYVSE